SGLASTTEPGSHGRPPRMSGPVGKDSERLEARARASSMGRCGWWRWRSRIVGPFRLDRGGLIAEEVLPAKAGVPIAALRVEDPKGRPPARRAIPVARDERLGPLADDVTPEPDPRPPGELEPEPGRFRDGRRQATAQARWLEDHEQRLGTTGERRQPGKAIGDPPRFVRRRRRSCR